MPRNLIFDLKILIFDVKKVQHKVPAKVRDSRASVLNRSRTLRSDVRSETLVRSLVRGLVRSHGVPFSIAIPREPSKVSLRSETLAAASPKFWLRFFETLAKTRGTLNAERTHETKQGL